MPRSRIAVMLARADIVEGRKFNEALAALLTTCLPIGFWLMAHRHRFHLACGQSRGVILTTFA